MNNARHRLTWFFHLLFAVCIPNLLSAQQSPLVIMSPSAYHSVSGTPFQIQLKVTGGSAPYSWKLLQVHLPTGLKLDPKTGLISGTPTVSGEFRIPVVVTDSSSPMQEARIDLIITLISAIEVVWKQPAKVQDGGIQGSVVVLNHTGRPLQLTVIILGVNEINKAFALGYQHFNFKPNSESPVIPFGSQLPYGSYAVHVDAIAEDAPRNTIHRSRLQTDRLTLARP